jgi:hypothetical protein
VYYCHLHQKTSNINVQTLLLVLFNTPGHFITEHLCKLLNLKQIHKNIPISDIGRSHSNITRITDLVFKSVTGEYSEKIQCLVLPKITNDLPLESFDPSNLNIPENLALADPTFYLSSRIDILIGAAVFYDLLRDGRIKLTNDKTYLQNSCLGWLIVVAEINKYRLCHVVSQNNTYSRTRSQ